MGFRRTILAGVRPRHIERIAAMKSQRFLNWVCYLVLVTFGTSNLTGCAVLSLADKSVTKEIGTETRPTKKLAKKDVGMVFTPKDDELIFRLQHQPHYREESRSIKEPSTNLGIAALMLTVGLAETVFLAGYLVETDKADSLKKEGIRTKAQTDEKLSLYDDDLELKPWVNKTALGVGLDVLLSLL